MCTELTSVQARTPTVCLVDDDPMIRLLFTRVIQRAGCKVIAADSVEEAEALLAGRSVDVLLSDLRMPEAVDGERLLINIKRAYPALPICMMSGEWDATTKARILLNGASACIIKPFTTQAFSQLMDSLEWWRVQPKLNKAN